MTMQHLREGIGLKGYAQRDPLVEYKEAAFGLFQELKDEIENQVCEMLLKAEAAKPAASTPVAAPQPTLVLQGADERLAGGGFAAATPLETSNAAPASPKAAPRAVAAPKQVVQKQESGVTVTVRSKGSPTAQEVATFNPYGNVGRNDLCPGGSGKKFKKCHGAQ